MYFINTSNIYIYIYIYSKYYIISIYRRMTNIDSGLVSHVPGERVYTPRVVANFNSYDISWPFADCP